MGAAGHWKVFEQAKLNLGEMSFDLATDTLKMALFTNLSNANTLSGSAKYADLTNEVANANGYTTGGITLSSLSWTNTAGTMTFTCAAVTWNASGGSITARYAVIYKVGTVNGIVNPILAICLLDATPADVTATSGNPLTITPNASGVITLSGATTD